MHDLARAGGRPAAATAALSPAARLPQLDAASPPQSALASPSSCDAVEDSAGREAPAGEVPGDRPPSAKMSRPGASIAPLLPAAPSTSSIDTVGTTPAVRSGSAAVAIVAPPAPPSGNLMPRYLPPAGVLPTLSIHQFESLMKRFQQPELLEDPRRMDGGVDGGADGDADDADADDAAATAADPQARMHTAALGLTLPQFTQAVLDVLGPQAVGSDQIALLYMKVDAASTGRMTWDAFASFMTASSIGLTVPEPQATRASRHNAHNGLREVRGDSIIETSFVHQPNLGGSSPHRDLIVRIEWVPKENKYVTVSRDGKVGLWTASLQLFRSLSLRELHASPTSWVTAMCMIKTATLNALVTATDDGQITVWDIWSIRPRAVVRITSLEANVRCFGFADLIAEENKILLLWGDTAGYVSILSMLPQAFSVNTEAASWVPFTAKSLLGDLETAPHGLALARRKVHADWVEHIQYYPELQSWVSCCNRGERSVVLGDPHRRSIRAIHIDKGAHVFDFCRRPSFLVTGGRSKLLMLWNPYILNKPAGQIAGHTSGIAQIVVDQDDGYIISCGEDKTIMIHEVRLMTCLFSMTDKLSRRPENTLTSLFYASRTAEVLVCCTGIEVVARLRREHRSGVQSHATAVHAVLYNDHFHHVVSTDLHGNVTVWDIGTGNPVFQFYETHGPNESVLAMAFDESGRRLITAGAADGRIKFWNANTGQLLKTITRVNKYEVNQLMYHQSQILTADGKRGVAIYHDRLVDAAPRTLPGRSSSLHGCRPHNDDITGLAFFPPRTVVSSSLDGVVIVWDLETGSAKGNLDFERREPIPAPAPSAAALGSRLGSASSEPADPLADLDLSGRRSVQGVLALRIPCLQPSDLQTSYANLYAMGATAPLHASTSGTTATALRDLVMVAHGDITLRIWDLATARLLKTVALGAAPGSGRLAALALSADQTRLLLGTSTGLILMVEVDHLVLASAAAAAATAAAAAAAAAATTCAASTTAAATASSRPPASPQRDAFAVDESDDGLYIKVGWRAHRGSVTSLTHLPRLAMVLSAGLDKTIRLFTERGGLVGIFGQSTPWDLARPPTWACNMAPAGGDDALLPAADAYLGTSAIDDAFEAMMAGATAHGSSAAPSAGGAATALSARKRSGKRLGPRDGLGHHPSATAAAGGDIQAGDVDPADRADDLARRAVARWRMFAYVRRELRAWHSRPDRHSSAMAMPYGGIIPIGPHAGAETDSLDGGSGSPASLRCAKAPSFTGIASGAALGSSTSPTAPAQLLAQQQPYQPSAAMLVAHPHRHAYFTYAWTIQATPTERGKQFLAQRAQQDADRRREMQQRVDAAHAAHLAAAPRSVVPLSAAASRHGSAAMLLDARADLVTTSLNHLALGSHEVLSASSAQLGPTPLGATAQSQSRPHLSTHALGDAATAAAAAPRARSRDLLTSTDALAPITASRTWRVDAAVAESVPSLFPLAAAPATAPAARRSVPSPGLAPEATRRSPTPFEIARAVRGPLGPVMASFTTLADPSETTSAAPPTAAVTGTAVTGRGMSATGPRTGRLALAMSRVAQRSTTGWSGGAAEARRGSAETPRSALLSAPAAGSGPRGAPVFPPAESIYQSLEMQPLATIPVLEFPKSLRRND